METWSYFVALNAFPAITTSPCWRPLPRTKIDEPHLLRRGQRPFASSDTLLGHMARVMTKLLRRNGGVAHARYLAIGVPKSRMSHREAVCVFVFLRASRPKKKMLQEAMGKPNCLDSRLPLTPGLERFPRVRGSHCGRVTLSDHVRAEGGRPVGTTRSGSVIYTVSGVASGP